MNKYSAFPAYAGASAGTRNPKSPPSSPFPSRGEGWGGGRGFTLIEIIVLIVMAGIIIPVIVVPFATGIRGSKKPEMVATAMYFAHQRMEELMKYNYRNGALTPAGVVAFATGDVNYPGENEIVYVDSNFSTPSGDVGYKRIRVRVTDPEANTYEVYSVVTNFP